MSGCKTNAASRNGTACQRFPARIRDTANRMSAVAGLRGCRYWSAINKAVPATGSVNMATSMAIPAHRATASSNSCCTMLQQASTIRKTERACQSNSAMPIGIPVACTNVAIEVSKMVVSNCSLKKLESCGYKSGFRSDLTAVR